MSETVSPGGWPSRVFAPYVNHWNNPANIMQKAAIGAGTKFFTLAFILADDKGQPAWNAWQLVTDGFLKTEIANLRARGGNVIFSLGGAGGKELAVVTGDVNALQQKYQVILNAYPGVSWLDFDIEGPHLDDTGANDRRNKALAALQRANPNIIIAYTLPTTPSGLLGNALSLLRSAKNNGLRVDRKFSFINQSEIHLMHKYK